MTPEALVDIFREALAVIVVIVSAIVVPGLLVGLVVAVFQAATSINEQT
ncbi:MAG: flagellar biosynthetic protein FliQ, partial [Shewanella sp.]|nr:flagellar biosynthetic protein FliQ [Shewanella sp.]